MKIFLVMKKQERLYFLYGLRFNKVLIAMVEKNEKEDKESA